MLARAIATWRAHEPTTHGSDEDAYMCEPDLHTLMVRGSMGFCGWAHVATRILAVEFIVASCGLARSVTRNYIDIYSVP